MKTNACVRQLAAGLTCMSIAAGAGAAVIDPALLALIGIPGISEVELTGAYAEAGVEAISSEYEFHTVSGSDPTTTDVTTSSMVTSASGEATAGADFPDSTGMGSAARASASALAPGLDLNVVDSHGTGFVAGGFEASGGGNELHEITFNFDVTAHVTLADRNESEDFLTAGVAAFALVFDNTFENHFLGGFSLDGGGLFGTTMAMRTEDWANPLLDADFTENSLMDCDAAASGAIPNQCTWNIDTTASVTYEYAGDFAAFSLLYGIQTSVTGAGTTYELISDASGTSILTSIEAAEDIEVIALRSQIVPEEPTTGIPEPTSAALLGIGLLMGTAAATRRGRRRDRLVNTERRDQSLNRVFPTACPS